MTIRSAAVEFTKGGTPAEPAQVEAVLSLIRQHHPTDVLLLSHGWNNDMDAARRLYRALMNGLEGQSPPGAADRLVVVELFWPSIRWADADQIAGGGVSVGDEAGQLLEAIDEGVDDADLAAQLKGLTADLASADARREFVTAARALLPTEALSPDGDDVPSILLAGDAEEVFTAVSDAVVGFDDLELPDAGGSGAPGVAPDLLGEGDTAGTGLFGRSWSSLARQVLNTFTYYTMKGRAGDVGTRGVAPLLERIHGEFPDVRLHLAGHSFGARVVSAAATSTSAPVASLTLLQGAFSHYGFTRNFAGSGKDGAFVTAVSGGHVAGPLVITHTHNDRAVGLAYAIASRLARQTGAAVGDAGDLYGGIGANGAVGAAATAVRMQAATGSYSLQDRTITNVLADDYVTGHSDVTNPAVVNLLAQAVRLR